MSKITDVLCLARFPDEARECFEELYSKIMADAELAELLERTERVYLAKEDSESFRRALAEKLDANIYTVDMLLLIYCAVGLRVTYAQKGYSEQLFYGVLTDLRCKLIECKNVHGIWGTFVFSWFYRFYNCTRFMLGRLQYETVEAKYDYKDVVRAGDTVYNCHIPSAGPLTPESVEESLRIAYDFYKIEGVMPVVCHSWLLYPEHYELFGANTRAFADRFDVIKTDEQEHNGDAWRVFSRGADDVEALPQNTSLQRNFYRYLKDGNKMGNGYGVLLYTPEKNSNMIKNVVFDLGQVLVRWNPLEGAQKFVDDPDDAALLADVVFDRRYWDKLDEGAVSEVEVMAAIKGRIPERLWDVAERILTEPMYDKPEVEGMYEIVKRISEDKSKRLFLLSNLSKTLAAQADGVRAVHLIKNRVFSSLCGYAKPDRKIFEYLCQTYNIKPEETLFIDDNPSNIESARKYGINGYWFDGDAKRLEAYVYPNEKNRD